MGLHNEYVIDIPTPRSFWRIYSIYTLSIYHMLPLSNIQTWVLVFQTLLICVLSDHYSPECRSPGLLRCFVLSHHFWILCFVDLLLSLCTFWNWHNMESAVLNLRQTRTILCIRGWGYNSQCHSVSALSPHTSSPLLTTLPTPFSSSLTANVPKSGTAFYLS